MKRIAMSLMTIAAVTVMVVGATNAYFHDVAAVRGNTFSNGTVAIGDLTSRSLTVTDLAPGAWTGAYELIIPYVGNLNADLYVGATGTSAPSDLAYFGDKLYVRAYSGSNVVYEGFANDLSTHWRKFASNVSKSDQTFQLYFYLDPSVDNSKQGVSNTDTELLIYAVQTGMVEPELSGMPYDQYPRWTVPSN
jgi:predicted ribosomally synthesized peptide with SipW-like signal peptide